MSIPLRIIILLFASILIAVSGYKLYEIHSEYAVGTELYDSVIEQYVIKQSIKNPILTADVEEKIVETREEINIEFSPFEIDFDILISDYPDVVGWIYSENTMINYPILQASDNNYYLRRMINGKYNISGSIFMDYRNNKNFNDYSTIIYGHNMKNSAMFGTLPKYIKQSYYETHPEMWMFTPDITYRIQLIAGLETHVDSEVYKFFNDKTHLNNFLNNVIEMSTFKTDVDISEVERIIILSTCSDEYDDERYVLIGNLIVDME